MSDNVNSPSHYVAGKFETIDIIEDCVKHAPDAVLGGLQWQVIKYVSRAWLKKDAYEDFCKARWYLNRLIDKLAAQPYQQE